ncbi:MAG TPA: hypothetical protein VHE30_16640 [Polyangiaceae bacterium]|nr:hypothetical protein [Polyangiaceae bacterium]
MALATTEGLSVELASAVTGQSKPAVVTDMPAGSSGSGINLWPLATAGTAYGASSILLQSGAQLAGDALAPNITLLPGATVVGTTNRAPALEPRVRQSFTVTFPPGPGDDVDVYPFGTRVLDPGRYDDATVRLWGELRLRSGEYYFDTLSALSGSTISFDQSHGPVVVYTRQGLSLLGSIQTPGQPGILPPSPPVFVHVGTSDVVSMEGFSGVVVATTAKLSLFGQGNPYEGAFFAKSIDVEGGVRVNYRPANVLAPLIFPPSGAADGLQACAEAIRPQLDLPRTQQALVQAAEINRYCAMVGASACYADIAARINADYTAASAALIAQTKTPAQYIAFIRDRALKKRAAQSDEAVATSLCTNPDGDGDFVVDGKDQCPSTPPLTPTDANGCTDPWLPPHAPSPESFADLASTGGWLVNPKCAGASLLSKPPLITLLMAGPDAVYESADDSRYLIATRITNQPAGCPVWYFVEVEERYTGNEYTLAFSQEEEVPGVAGLSEPVPPQFIQFRVTPQDPGGRGALAKVPRNAGGGSPVRLRMKLMNGNGLYSNWSDWILPDPNSCKQLGVFCR